MYPSVECPTEGGRPPFSMNGQLGIRSMTKKKSMRWCTMQQTTALLPGPRCHTPRSDWVYPPPRRHERTQGLARGVEARVHARATLAGRQARGTYCKYALYYFEYVRPHGHETSSLTVLRKRDLLELSAPSASILNAED